MPVPRPPNANLPPDWPINYPFVANKDKRYEPDNSIKIKRGDCGIVLATRDFSNGMTIVKVCIPSRDRDDPGSQSSGFVMAADINIGITRPYGSVAWNLGLPQTQAPPTGTWNDASWGPMERLMSDILLALQQHCTQATTEMRDFLPPWLPAMIDTDQKIKDLVDDIHQGVLRAGVHGKLSQDTLTVMELKDAGRVLPQGVFMGVYSIVYWNWKDGHHNPDTYCGSSMDINNRDGFHIDGPSDPNHNFRPHYVSAQQANSRKLFPLYLTKNPDSNKLFVIEQLFFLVLQKYHPYVTAPIRTPSQRDGQMAVGGSERHVFYQRMACFLMNLSMPIIQRHGWKKGCWFPEFQAGKGLNWSSPLMETRKDKALYVRTTVPGVLKSYRRQPFVVSEYEQHSGFTSTQGQVNKYKRYGMFSSKHNKPNGDAYWDEIRFGDPLDAPGPALGEEVQMIFEIMEGNMPHAAPWCRIPDHFPWQKREEAVSLGIRIEWQYEGAWKTKYLQSAGSQNHPRTPANTDQLGFFTSYHNAMAMIRLLKGQRLSSTVEGNKNFGIGWIRELNFDHLTQTFSVSHVQQQGTPVTDHKRTKQQMRGELATLGADKIGLPKPAHWPVGGPQRRSVCDRCLIMTKQLESGIWYTSDPSGEVDMCIMCQGFLSPCTWTPTKTIQAQKEKFFKFYGLKRENKEAKSVSDVPYGNVATIEGTSNTAWGNN